MAALGRWKGLLQNVLMKRSLNCHVRPISTSHGGQWAKKKGDDAEVPEFIPTVPEELDEDVKPLGGRHFSPPSEDQLKKAQELFDTLLKGSGTVSSVGQQPAVDIKENTVAKEASPEQLIKAKELFESFEKVVGDDPTDVTFTSTPVEETEPQEDSNPRKPSQSQIVRAQQLFENLSGMLIKADADDQEPIVEYDNFASMLRKSSLVGLGNPKGSMVSGEIFDVIDDDLYIDFGGKFHAVCKVPPVYLKEGRSSKGLYGRGKEVRLRINQLEMSSRFLEGQKDITLLEANCTLSGPLKRKRSGQV